LKTLSNKKSPDASGLYRIKNDYPFEMDAEKYSRLRRAMLELEISLGHSASQAPVFVQEPKPSSSI
jgi:hypothetical protein